MAVSLLVTAALRGFTDRKAELSLEGGTVDEILKALVSEYPDIKTHIFDENGDLRAFINIFVGENNIKTTGGLSTKVKDGDTLTLVPAIAGGKDNEGRE
ncbi:MAG: MoaD family protein [Deltaproteobacteria bacterium]|jgi:MoaD family protein|nr:MoaD family protein [Deltaproteobacteria bacterium]